eukprot:Blabericola_migrator_1__3051@NODE_188_length_11708_cov_118_709303_g163_i0_p1_GENE_NODE_188_length_11708_cov_118_709303_g163_i0NODE_188_length_11708_cov_118_709303_g163_i0_p1_ORF_typecomplete_len1566_score301_13UCH/PF00443_29/5_9e68UCH_1/PF13423_6/8_1e19UCH_1/PF13423_6/1e04UCH_1/PF13423_6/2e03Arnt_C/PF18583_1/0_023_NODE_188_length_11708_cov_118_709303_g163_i043039000
MQDTALPPEDDSLNGGASSSMEEDNASACSANSAPNPSSQPLHEKHTVAPWANHHQKFMPQSIPPLDPTREGELVLDKNWMSNNTSRIESAPLVIGNRFKCSLKASYEYGPGNHGGGKLYVYIQAGEPPCVTEEKSQRETNLDSSFSSEEGRERHQSLETTTWDLDKWEYPDVHWYICVVHHTDWRQSHFNNGKGALSSVPEGDRTWPCYPFDIETLHPYADPEGTLTFRFGVEPGCLVWKDSDAGHRGLRNHGTTCYLNSLLQCLYPIGKFRKAVWETSLEEDKVIEEEFKRVAALHEAGEDPAIEEDGKVLDGVKLIEEAKGGFENCKSAMYMDNLPGTPQYLTRASGGLQQYQVYIGNVKIEALGKNFLNALQKIFYLLDDKTVQSPVPCVDLLTSFGWDSADLFMQHDAQELNRLLCDRLEEQMKSTPAEGSIKKLFGGELEVCIECLNVAYESKRSEIFYDLQLDIQNVDSLAKSLDKYVEAEILDGENKYHAEGHGPQPAKKGVRFLSFPPVLQFHLKRFEFDLQSMDMIKLNDLFEFPEVINFDKWCPNAGEYRLFAVDVHQGDVHQGHYYTFIKTFHEQGLRNKLWLKFDDETVFLVDRYTAVDANYGGPIPSVQSRFLTELREYNYKTNAGGLGSGRLLNQYKQYKHYSAYILFYIKQDLINELMTCPPPDEVNFGMTVRCEVSEALAKKEAFDRRWQKESLVVKLLAENDLWANPAGFWQSRTALNIRMCLQRPRKMTAYAFWCEVLEMIGNGSLGKDLQDEYARTEDGYINNLPALFYVDFSEPPPSPNQQDGYHKPDLTHSTLPYLPEGLCGWSEEYCQKEELGFGPKLWFLEMKQGSRQSDLMTNLEYLGPDTLELGVLYLVILPIPKEVLPDRMRSLPDEDRLTQMLEQYNPSAIKIFDDTPAKAIEQNVYFLGFIDIFSKQGNRHQVLQDITNRILRKLVSTWSDPEKRERIKDVLHSGSSLASTLEKTLKDMRENRCFVRDGSDCEVFDPQRAALACNIWSENRGYVVPMFTSASQKMLVQDLDYEGRVLLFTLQCATGQRPLLEEEAYRAKIGALKNLLLTSQDRALTYRVQKQMFFCGEATPWPYVLPPDKALTPETLVENVPHLYSKSSVAEWLAQLRQERRVAVEVYDIAQALGRWEGLSGQALEPQREPDDTSRLSASSIMADGSPTDASDFGLVKKVIVPVHLGWPESFFLEYISTMLLNCDLRYLVWFSHNPLVSQSSLYTADTVQPIREPLARLRQDGSNRRASTIFGQLCKSQQLAGATRLFSSCCCDPLTPIPPTFHLGIMPRSLSESPASYIIIRFFSCQFGSLGIINIERPHGSMLLRDIVEGVKAHVDTKVLIERIGEANTQDLMNQDFELVEYTCQGMRRYDSSLRWRDANSLVQYLSFERQLRIEPALRWLPLDPTQKTPTSLASVEITHMVKGDYFGHPFCMLVAADEKVEIFKQRLMLHCGFALGNLEGAKLHKYEACDKSLRPLQDSDNLYPPLRTGPKTPGPKVPGQSTWYPRLPFGLVLKHKEMERGSSSKSAAMSLHRRANPTLHINS